LLVQYFELPRIQILHFITLRLIQIHRFTVDLSLICVVMMRIANGPVSVAQKIQEILANVVVANVGQLHV